MNKSTLAVNQSQLDVQIQLKKAHAKKETKNFNKHDYK